MPILPPFGKQQPIFIEGFFYKRGRNPESNSIKHGEMFSQRGLSISVNIILSMRNT